MPFYRSWAAFSVIALIHLVRRHALLLLGTIVVTQVLEQAWIGLIHERVLRGAIAFPVGLLLWFLVMNGFVLLLILALDDANAGHPTPPLLSRALDRWGVYYRELLKVTVLFVTGIAVVVVLGPVLQLTAIAGVAAVLLGVPGLVLLARLSLLPCVVLLEPRPVAGPWEVLRRTLSCTRPRGGLLLAVLLVWMALMGLLRRFVLPRHQYFLEDLLDYALNVTVDYLFAIGLFTLLYTLYRHLRLDEQSPAAQGEPVAAGGQDAGNDAAAETPSGA